MIDTEAVALSVIPFLKAPDLKNFLATNSLLYSQYDNDILWRKIGTRFLSSRRYNWDNYTKREIKKCIHFRQLSKSHCFKDLIDEVTNHEQLSLMIRYVNKSRYSPNTKYVLRTLISLLKPQFLHYADFPYFPRSIASDEQLQHILRGPIRSYTMHELADVFIDWCTCNRAIRD